MFQSMENNHKMIINGIENAERAHSAFSSAYGVLLHMEIFL
jgi:hypothetical protein